MAIEITAKRAGFRRAGVAHADTPTVYAKDHFSDEQLEQLKAELMLVVNEVPDARLKKPAEAEAEEPKKR